MRDMSDQKTIKKLRRIISVEKLKRRALRNLRLLTGFIEQVQTT